ncbi:MAG: ATP-grasp domain-containing protein [Acidobacteria bacterium]|nr:ATP-grasp domain-containing protein [Acidobacteriota bacterium]
MFRRLLIANRGEIAVRIIRACREAGITAVAVHSEADRGALHVRGADEAVELPGSNSAETYLNIPLLLDVARRSRCQAVHPGYGFLSENADFAEAVTGAGLVLVGPSAPSIRQLGDKTRARELAQAAGAPVVPGYDRAGSDKEFEKQAKKLGYPVLVKAAGGGGGRGMRVVEAASQLAEALASARREAQSAFSDSRVFLERFIPSARHVEIQILGDREGRVISLFERDCSIQRRHQKILEESPSPALNEDLRARMGAAAVAVAKAAAYVNAGTVEFLLDADSGEFYFLEMNTRLQVEHPVTEILTGVDLVLAQLQLAAGEPLAPAWAAAHPRGHALECRIYAEDPASDFAPSPGRILRWESPQGPGTRVDSGYAQGDEVPVHYDPLLAKVIVGASDRKAAVCRMERALGEMVILGPVTNLAFLQEVLAHPVFRSGKAATDFLARYLPQGGEMKPPPDEILIAAALLASEGPGGAAGIQRGAQGDGEDPEGPWARGDSFRLGSQE